MDGSSDEGPVAYMARTRAYYRALGYDTVAIGAGASRPQDIYAHGLNERMRVDAFYAGLDHWSIVLKELAGG